MSNDTQPTATPPAPVKPKPQMLVLRESIEGMAAQFKAALPAHVPAERFVRTALTALQLNPDMAKCEPKSVYAACMKAAQDGLVLDGREAALVKFGDNAQYMPMVQGILKKARNSGEISYISARVVHEKDTFTVVYGDEEKLEHIPCLDADPGPARLAYMVAKLKDGSIVREIMTRTEIEKVRATSRSKNAGPWVAWPDEMWRKTVLRRGAKYLPSSSDRSDGTDVLDIVSRDDALYEAGEAIEGDQAPAAPRGRGRPKSTGGAGEKLNAAAKAEAEKPPVDDVDPETGEILEPQGAENPAKIPPTPVEDSLAPPPHLRRAAPPKADEPPPPTADDVI